MADDLETLKRELAQQREVYGNLLAKTREYANAPDLEVARAIAACAEEFGAKDAVKRIAKDPDAFGLNALPDGTTSRLETSLERLTDVAYAIDALTARREDILREGAPGRVQVMAAFGRELAVDEEHDRLIYVDGTIESMPLGLEHVHTRLAPRFSHSPDPLSRTPDRNRRRDRER